MKLTIDQAAKEFAVSAETLRRGLIAIGAETKRGTKHPLHTIHRALAGDLKVERVREAKARADLMEQEHAENSRVLVRLDEVQRLVSACMLPIRQRFIALASEMAARVNPTDPSHARTHLQAWSDDAMRLIQADILKQQPK